MRMLSVMCLLLNISKQLHVKAFLPLCKDFVTKSDRLLEIKTLFSWAKEA